VPKLITEHLPVTGDELEDAVKDILAECGLAAERRVHLTLPRGGANIDVRATETIDGISTSILCECKNWATSVPQSVVHGFRTIMQESGAHRGYIISKAGFQKGAIDAAFATNIELVTFEQFQNIYFDKWIAARCWVAEHEIGNIATYYEPFGIPGMGDITDEAEQARYYEVWRRYLFVGTLLLHFSPYARMIGSPSPLPALPIDTNKMEEAGIVVPGDIKAVRGYRELLRLLTDYARVGLAELRSHNPITRGRPSSEISRDD
jgi:hypothetical protein